MAVLDVVIDEQLQNHHHSGDVSSPIKSELQESKEKESPVDKAEDTEASSSDTHEVPIPISSEDLQETDAKCVNQNSLDVIDKTDDVQSATEDTVVGEKSYASQTNQSKLPNFTLGCYHTNSEDIYDPDNAGKPVTDTQQVQESNDHSQNGVKNSDVCVGQTDSSTDLDSSVKPEMFIQKRKALDVKIISLKEREKENSDHLITKGQVQEKRAQFIGLGTQTLGGRSVSLHNLTPQKKIVKEILSSEDNAESSANGLYRTQSDQNVAQENSEVDEKQIAFIQEQKRLYEEYQKLQAQFISWQKQLMNNQSLLQNEQIMPKIVFPTFDGVGNNLNDAHKVGEDENNKTAVILPQSEASFKSNVQELKTRSLPRPKPQPFSLKEASVARSVSPPLKRADETIVKSIACDTVEVAENDMSSKIRESQTATVADSSLKPTQDVLFKTPNVVVPEDRISPDVIYEEVKSQTLPRPKPQTTGAFVESRTMTLNRHSRPKSQIVSVTIGSWQQRNEPVTDIDSSSVASVRSKFQSLENIPQGTSKTGVAAPQEPAKISTSVAPEKKTTASKLPVSGKSADVKLKNVQSVVDKEKHPKYIQKPDATRHASKPDKISKSDTLSQTRYPKPLIRLTSMKDDFQLPSLRTCNKWPLGEMNQKDNIGSDPLREELKSSAKTPSGVVREKIHRAEVDLRHHSKKDKHSSETHSKHKEVDLRRVSSKSEPGWTQKKYKESDLRQSKSETIPSDSKSIENCSKSESLPRSEPSTSQISNKGTTAVRPSKLHITTVSIHNSENAQGTTPPEVKSPRTPKLAYGSLKYEGSESKLRTMAELKSVLAQKTAEREEANRKILAGEPKADSTPVNGSVPPPPPPPASAMPVIPPAAPIPISSQLVMGKQASSTATVKRESTSQSQVQESKDPREELMLEIRGFGGRQALRKVPVAQASWHLKVFGPAKHSLNSS